EKEPLIVEELHRVAEHLQSLTFRGEAAASPLWMLRGEEMPIRVRHEAHGPAGCVADAGDVVLRAVRVDRINPAMPVPIAVAQHHLPRLIEAANDPLLAAQELPFAVPNRHVDALDAFEEGAFAGRGLHADPAILVVAGVVAGERGERAVFIR